MFDEPIKVYQGGELVEDRGEVTQEAVEPVGLTGETVAGEDQAADDPAATTQERDQGEGSGGTPGEATGHQDETVEGTDQGDAHHGEKEAGQEQDGDPPKKAGPKGRKTGKNTREPAPESVPEAEPATEPALEPAPETEPEPAPVPEEEPGPEVETEPKSKKPLQSSAWVEVYSSRQNRSFLKWPVVAIEQHMVRNGQEEVLCLVVGKGQLKGYIGFEETGIKASGSVNTDRIRLLKYIGQEIAFIVTGIVYNDGYFVASRKFALARLSKRMWPNLKKDMVVHAVARKVYDSNVIVEFDGIEARLPISEISYGWVDEMADHVQPGDELDVKVIRIDPENERVTVSLKSLIPNPWPGAMDRYQKNGIYLGKVTGVVNFGVFVELEPGVNALCNHLRTTSKYQAEEGDQVAVQVGNVTYENGEGRIRGGVIRIVRKAS